MKQYLYYWQYWKQRMHPISKLMYYLGIIRLYANKAFIRTKFRWYHPLSWVVFCIAIVLTLFTSNTIQGSFKSMFFVDRYFRKNPSKLYWFNPWSDKKWKGKK